MTKNIYTKLGFKTPSEYLYSADRIDDAKKILHELPLQHTKITPLIIEQSILAESLAISTAEDSRLNMSEANTIELSPEQTVRILKYRENKTLSEQEKYEQLEFENIKAVEHQVDSLSFTDLTTDLICRLHHDLTIGLDDYRQAVGTSQYHSGKLRQSESVRVGKVRQYTPPQHKEIKKLLKLLCTNFANRKKIALPDILEFHLLFYAIHPFQNGNKRVVRILESMLLNHYGYSAQRSISLAVYYSEKKDGVNFFLMQSLLKKDLAPFVNFAIRGYFYSINMFFQTILQRYLEHFSKQFDAYITQNIKSLQAANYQKAKTSILQLKGAFAYTDFIEQMKKNKCSVGISQSIIKDLLKKGILQKKGKQYYYGEMLQITTLTEKLMTFSLRHSIDLVQHQFYFDE